MTSPTIEEAKEMDERDVEIEERHYCGTRLILTKDLDEYGGHVLVCPACSARVRKV